MDQAIKEKWVKALRSGRYRQARSSLYEPSEDAHCCLGVLCRVMRLKPNPKRRGFCGLGEQSGWLNREMLRRVGMKNSTQMKLSEMNDDEGKSFEEIANYIERRL